MFFGKSKGSMAIPVENHAGRFYGCSHKCRIRFTFVHMMHEVLQIHV